MTTIVQSAMTAAVPVPDLSSVETQLAVQNLRSVINNNSAYIRAVDGIADEFADVTGISPVTVAAAYITGDRQSSITMSWNDQSSTAWNPASSLSVAIDGNTSSGHLYPNGSGTAAVANTWIQFEFAIAIYISEIKEYYAVTTANSDTWKWQGSLDGTTWIDITATTNWGGNPTTQTRAITASAGPYNYLRKHGVSGSNVGTTGLREVEFKTYATGDSINITYDGTGDYYTTLGPDVDQVPTMTSNSAPSGTASASSENTTAQQAWKVFNDATGDAWYGATAGTGWIKYDFGSGVTKTPVAIKIQASSSPTGAPASGTIQGSNDGSTWTTLKTLSGLSWTANEIKTFTISSTTAYRYFFFYIVPSSGGPSLGEIQILEAGSAANMTLISETFTAETAPSESSAVFLHQPVAAVTLNTDILGYISRDAGTTWTQGTLVDAGSFDSTTNILTMNAVDISSQPSGTSMKYKIVTANAKEQRLHGAWLAWS